MALESDAAGRAFLADDAAPPGRTRCSTRWRASGCAASSRCRSPSALAAAAHGDCRSTRRSPAYLHAFAANLVSAGVRLIPLGQTDGQRVIAGAGAASSPTTAAACRAPLELDDLGTAAPLLDWCSMRHETQYTRLFRS